MPSSEDKDEDEAFSSVELDRERAETLVERAVVGPRAPARLEHLVEERADVVAVHEPGAHADLIVVDGDPLRDIGLLAQDGKRLTTIVRGGEVVKG